MKNDNYFLITTQRCVPQEQTKTGTITTSSVYVNGVGTLFTTELMVNQWVYVTAQNAIRRITAIHSDILLQVDEAFGADVAVAIALKIVPESNITELSVVNLSAVTGKIDNVNFVQGQVITFSKSNKVDTGKNYVDPITVDGTGSNISCTTIQ